MYCVFQGALLENKEQRRLLLQRRMLLFLKLGQLVMIKRKEEKEMCPRKPRKPYKHLGCPKLTEKSYC